MKAFFKFFVGSVIGTMVLLVILCILMDVSDQKENPNKHPTITLSDTLLVGNDSLRTDILRRDYGFYIAKNKLDLKWFPRQSSCCTYTIGYWCYNPNLKGARISLFYKCYTEEGTIICKGNTSDRIGAGDGDSEILNFNVWLDELMPYRGIVTIVPSIGIGNMECLLPKIKVKLGGMFGNPKVIEEKTE